MRDAVRAIVVLAAATAGFPALAASPPSAAEVLRAALPAACRLDPFDVAAAHAAFPDARFLSWRLDSLRGEIGRSRHRLLYPDGRELAINRLFPGGTLRRVAVELYEPAGDAGGKGGAVRPRLSVSASADCRVIEARRIDYRADGHAASVVVLQPDLQTVVQTDPLDPPVPPGRDPGGVLVAHVDSGVNYTLPTIAKRLARTKDGALIGYDYWDMDPRPYDVDTSRSPFFPLHHGTATASVLLREAPEARIAPYRYPRPDMARMADVIAAAAKAGARIVHLAMGSNDRAEWDAFAEAAEARPEMLFVVSAGNDGRDIDRAPVYPAALDLANMLVITSCDRFGRLAQGSNWGQRSVDLMVPAEQVEVTDHRGAVGKASGSSFAVPRVAAMAARLLAAHPGWHAGQLRRAIVDRARPVQGRTAVRYGWIPDPTDDFQAKQK